MQYSAKLYLSWNFDQQEIVSRICQLIRQGMAFCKVVGGIDLLFTTEERETDGSSGEGDSDNSSFD